MSSHALERAANAAHRAPIAHAWPFAVLLALSGACSAPDVGPAPEALAERADALQANCGCSATGTFVAPALSPLSATSATYSATSAASNGLTSLTVRRRSDNASVFSASAPVPTAANPNPVAFGFGPGGNTFVYRYVQQGLHNVILVDLSSGTGRVVYQQNIATSSSVAQFSPRGRYFVYAHVSAPSSVRVDVVDSVSGALAHAATHNIFTQTLPPPGGSLDVGNWGFSPDEETFVSAHVSGQGAAQWSLINLVRSSQVASAQITTSGSWAFSPCSDVIGLVEVSRQGNATVRLVRTSDGASLGSASGRALSGGVQLSTTRSAHIATISGIASQLAPNSAAAPCPTSGLAALSVSPAAVPAGQLAKGLVTLASSTGAEAISVSLRSSNPGVAAVPSTITVPPRSSQATFTIETGNVRLTTSATITASLRGVSRSATLQVSGPVACFGQVCAPPNQCQASVSCDVARRRCSYTLKPTGSACNDNNPNTVGDACNDGACIGVDRCANVTCPAAACQASSCDRATGSCVSTPLPDGQACDDGDASTAGDSCSGGVCRGTDRCAQVSCPSTACRASSCDPTIGSCTSTALPDGTPCDDGDASTSGDACSAGVCRGAGAGCNATNLALNPGAAGYPDPTQSDTGWGGGSYPWDLVDGLMSYDTWARGLAFTGGHQDASGGPPYLEPAGVRHAVIDLGAAQTFDQIVLWWHGAEHTPDTGSVEVWDGAQWQAVAPVVRHYAEQHAEGANAGYSDSDRYTFSPVTGSKVRYTFDNSGLNIVGTANIHGWLYEFEVFDCPER